MARANHLEMPVRQLHAASGVHRLGVHRPKTQDLKQGNRSIAGACVCMQTSTLWKLHAWTRLKNLGNTSQGM